MDIRDKQNSGVLLAIGYYVLGFIISFLIYVFLGWDYKHAPGFHHYMFILFLFGGFVMLLSSLLKISNTKFEDFHREFALTHAVILIIFITWFVIKLINVL